MTNVIPDEWRETIDRLRAERDEWRSIARDQISTIDRGYLDRSALVDAVVRLLSADCPEALAEARRRGYAALAAAMASREAERAKVLTALSRLRGVRP